MTNNYGLTLPTVGGDVGTWGGIVNSNVFTFLDAFLGNVLPVTMTNADVTLTLSQWQNNGVFKITGALAGNLNLILPLTSALSVDAGVHAVAGKFIVDNETTNNFTITVKTAVGGSVGVIAPQGGRVSMYSDNTNVLYADDSQRAKLRTFAGNPNGSVTGIAGNAPTLTPADVIWDSTDQTLYVSNGGTTWVSSGQTLPPPGGYVTPSSGTPIITGDSVGATSLFYTPARSNLCPIFNGSSFVIFTFAELALALAAGSQQASKIYDVFAFINAGALQVGFGPSWDVGASPGSVAPGSCSRGTGAGSTAVNRLNGVLVNTNIITLNNGGSSFANIPVSQATYLASIYVDTAAGAVTCLRSYGGGGGGGKIRKWGIWNYYNRVPIRMQGGSSAVNWNYTAPGLFRQSNTDVNNAVDSFCGVAEEQVNAIFLQNVLVNDNNGAAAIGIGVNTTASSTGFIPELQFTTAGTSYTIGLAAQLVLGPSLGINRLNTIESTQGATSGVVTFFGTPNNMLHVVTYNG